jgi:hypothetical protein
VPGVPPPGTFGPGDGAGERWTMPRGHHDARQPWRCEMIAAMSS